MTRNRTHQQLTEWATALADTKARNAQRRAQAWQELRDSGQVFWSDSLGRYVTIPD